MGQFVFKDKRHEKTCKGPAIVFSYHLFQNYVMYLSSITKIIENLPALSNFLKK